MRYFSRAIFLVLLPFIAISQKEQKNTNVLLKEFKEADSYYFKALKVNTNTPFGEKQEQLYNQLALNKFKLLEKDIIDAGYFYDSLRFRLYLKAGELAHYFDSLPSALQYYSHAILLKANLPGMADSLIFKPYIFSGHIYFYRNQLDSATYYFKKAEDIQVHYAKKLRESERLYNDLGVLYFQGGNYRLAANYFRKASDMLEKSNPFYDDFWVNYNINYAIALFKLESYDKAESILIQLLPFQKHLNEINNNLGLIAEKKGISTKAIKFYRKVKYGNGLDAGLENDKASSWLSLKQFDSAGKALEVSEAISQKYNKQNTSIDHGLTYKISGDLDIQYNKYLTALNFYQQALHQFYPSFRENSIHINPQQFSGAFSYIHVFNTLIAKANACHLLYESTGNIAWANDELSCYQSSFDLIDYIERVYESDEARLFLGKMKVLIHNKPINLAIDLYIKTKNKSFLEKAFVLDQKNKASVLVFHDQQNQVINPSGALRRREQLLKEQITRLNLSAAALNNDSAIKSASRNIGELEIQLGKVQEEIGKTYSSLIQVNPKLAVLQKMLDERSLLLSYNISDTMLTIFRITTTDISYVRKNLYAGFQEDLQLFINALHEPTDNITSENAGNNLFALLLKGVLDKKYSRIIIIPENELNYLPFETLKENGNYLIRDYSFQYQYSTLLLKNEPADFKEATIISFAPFINRDFSDKNVQFGQLNFSEKEIKDLKGNQFVGAEATKKNFLEHIYGKDIVHLATHAVASNNPDKPSFIAFAPWDARLPIDYLLYSPEIYNLSLQNKLVILSACETGYGRLERGEGVMSLTRAFAYAGCPDIITSFWKAEDESTAYISAKFHLYLKKGLPIDLALQRAKNDYLADKSINPRKKQPAYWANLVFIGNYQPLTHSFPSIWLIVFVFGLVLYLILRKPLKVLLLHKKDFAK